MHDHIYADISSSIPDISTVVVVAYSGATLRWVQ